MAELRALTVQSGTEKKQVVRKSDMSKPRRPAATTTTPAEKKKAQGNMVRGISPLLTLSFSLASATKKPATTTTKRTQARTRPAKPAAPVVEDTTDTKENA